MSRKRQNTSSAEPDSPPENDRLHNGSWSYEREIEQPRIDSKSGLVGAFPGLTDNDDLFYGPATNGLDYLRMVRSEATTIPHLLTTSTVDPQIGEYNEEYEGEEDGFFDDDEAFIAKPVLEESVPRFSRAQEEYYKSILLQFEALRALLRCTPPLEIIRKLPETLPISFPSSSRSARKVWEAAITSNDPNPVQIACMDAESTMELVRFVTHRMRMLFGKMGKESTERFDTWLWAMLAKCPDVGQLTSEEISDLRAFAQAVHMTCQWLHDRRTGTGMDTEFGSEDAGTDTDTPNGFEDEGQERDYRDVQDPKPSANWPEKRVDDAGATDDQSMFPVERQFVILDMILTVVGETYGQRDLLELRRPWTVIA